MSKPVVLKRWKIGRVQVGLRVYRHRYPTTADRWVFQPELIYDQRERI